MFKFKHIRGTFMIKISSISNLTIHGYHCICLIIDGTSISLWDADGMGAKLSTFHPQYWTMGHLKVNLTIYSIVKDTMSYTLTNYFAIEAFLLHLRIILQLASLRNFGYTRRLCWSKSSPIQSNRQISMNWLYVGSMIKWYPNLTWLNTSQIPFQKVDSATGTICGPYGTQSTHNKLLQHWRLLDSSDMALRMRM